MAQPGCKPAGKGADKPSSKENFAKSMGVMIKKNARDSPACPAMSNRIFFQHRLIHRTWQSVQTVGQQNSFCEKGPV